MSLECPECSYSTRSGKQFVDHLITYHKEKAVEIFLRFLASGKIKIEAT